MGVLFGNNTTTASTKLNPGVLGDLAYHAQIGQTQPVYSPSATQPQQTTQAPAPRSFLNRLGGIVGKAADVTYGLGKGIVTTPQGLVRGLVYGAGGANDLLAKQKQASESDQENTLRAINLFKQGKISKDKLTQMTSGSSVSQANYNDINNALSQRNIAASGVSTAAMLALPGAEGLLSKLGVGGRIAANVGIGAGFGALSGAQGDKFNLKETAKQAAIGGAVGGATSALGEGLGALSRSKAAAAKIAANNAAVAQVDNSAMKAFVDNSPSDQKLLSAGGQHQLPQTVSSSEAGALKLPARTTSAGETTVSGESKALMGDSARAGNQTGLKLATALNNVDKKLAAVEKGTLQVTPEERLQLFRQRQALAGGDLAATSNAAIGEKVSPLDAGVGASSSTRPIASLDAKIDQPVSETLTESAPKARAATTNPYGYTQEVHDTLDKVQQATQSGNSKQAVKELSSIFTPARGDVANGVRSDLRASLGEVTAQRAQAEAANAETSKFFAKQPTGDNLNFIQRIESGVKQPTPALEQHAAFFKDWFQKDLGLAREVKATTPELPNYFARSGMWKDPAAVEEWAKKFMQPSLTGNPAAVNERQFPTIYDAIKGGMVPKETNPMTIALNNRAQLVKAIQMQKFIDTQVTKGVDPAITQAFVDRVMERGFKDSAIYQTAKQAGYGVNNLQLGLSGFHLTGTAINAQVSELSNAMNYLATGHPIKAGESAVKGLVPGGATADYLKTGRDLRSDFLSGKDTPMVKYAKQANIDLGSQPVFRQNGLSKSVAEFQAGSKAHAIAAAPFRALSSFSKPLMEWWVPNMKAGAFQRGMEAEISRLGPSASEDALKLAAQKVGDSVDNRFGKVNLDNLFWNQKVKDTMGVFMRSPGWNIGTVREIGGGATDLLKPSTYKGLATGKGISNRSAYTLSLAAGTALMGGTLQYMFTGKWPTEMKDFFYPKTGQTDKNGNPERVAMPTYAKDVFSFAHNPVSTVKNKLSPVLSIGAQTLSNKDYFGNMVRNPNDSAGTQLKQVGGYVGKNVLPFSITNSGQRVDKSVGTKAQSFFGLTPAPAYITKTPLEQSVQNALNHALGSKSLTPEEAATAQAKTKVAQSSGTSQLERQLSLLMKVDRPSAARIITTATPKDIQSLSPSLLNQIRSTAAYTLGSTSPSTKQATKDASNSLLQKLGGNQQDLYNQKKADLKTAAKQRAQNKKYGR